MVDEMVVDEVVVDEVVSDEVLSFKTVFDAHSRHTVFSNSGEKERPNYKPQYAKNGTYELVEDGVFHSYEDIQAWLPTCDMSNIMDRYIRTGDDNFLKQRAGFYADVTDLPTNYAELHNILNNADNVFNSLPLDLREKFGNSPAVFYSDEKNANEIIGDYFRSNDTADVNPDVKPDIQVEKGVDIIES